MTGSTVDGDVISSGGDGGGDEGVGSTGRDMKVMLI